MINSMKPSPTIRNIDQKDGGPYQMSPTNKKKKKLKNKPNK